MSEQNDILRAINSCKKQYADAKANNAELQKKIDKLDDAIRAAKRAYDRSYDMIGAIKKLDAKSSWKGNNRNSFARNVDGITSVAKTYRSDIATTIDTLQAEKRKLRSQQNMFVQLMSSIETQINRHNKELSSKRSEANAATSGGGSR